MMKFHQLGERVNYYNGYSPKKRERELRYQNKLFKEGKLKPSQRPCQLCADPECVTEYHLEDYSEPFIVDEFNLCHYCHLFAIHRCFNKPHAWQAYLAHVRRGGYSRDIKENPAIKKEYQKNARALEKGEAIFLDQLRDRHFTGNEWWQNLSTDPKSLYSFDYRPRAYEDLKRALDRMSDEFTKTHKELIQFHLNARDMTISMQELAEHMGYSNYTAANLGLGGLAKKICEQSEYLPPTRKGGPLIYMYIIAHEGKPKENGDFTWKMNRPAVEVFRECLAT